jgi:hypothetical protein
MAQIHLDTTGNENLDRTVHHIEMMMKEIYAGSGLPVPLPVASGGTNAITAAAALTSLGAAASGANADITGMTALTTLHLDTGTKTATASSGAATLNKSAGIITTEALSTAAGSDYTLTLTNSQIAAGDQAFVSVDSNGSAGLPLAYSVKTTSTTLTVIVRNVHASAAFNAAIKIAFAILKN